MTHTHILAIILCFLLVSCSKNSDVNSIRNIPFTSENEFSFEDLFDLSIIRLEKKPESLIGRIHKVTIVDSLIFILDKDISKSLFVFDLNGTFLNKIGQLGKGAGEYLYLSDFDIHNNHIFLLSGFDRKIIEFDYSGKLISERKLSAHGGYALKCINRNTFMTVRANSLFSIYFWNNKGKLTSSNTLPELSFVNHTSKKSISSTDEKIIVTTAINDTIYQIINKKPEPLYTVDFEKEKIPWNTIDSKEKLRTVCNSRMYCRLLSVIDTEDFLFLEVLDKKSCRCGIYVKENDELLVCKKNSFGNIPLISMVGEVQNGPIFCTDAHILNSIKRNSEKQLVDIPVNVTNDDNPFLFILRSKANILN